MTEWKQNLSSYSAQVVGQTLVFLNGSRTACRLQECNLGNLICDAMVSVRSGLVRSGLVRIPVFNVSKLFEIKSFLLNNNN